jgi:pyridoxamine 5'-phosphate oxidase
MKIDIAHLRQDYQLKSLDISDVLPDPIEQFGVWFHEAISSEILEPNAMTLATINTAGKPSARIVLLKECNANGFVFYTNYESNKGQELAANPYAALCFNWLDLQRQVRIEGTVKKVSDMDSEIYFKSRPFKSRLGAWASPQSKVIENREILEENMQKLEEKYASTEGVPRPSHWGGYIVLPDSIEFWQGRRSRLHDRIRYTRSEQAWIVERLAP